MQPGRMVAAIALVGATLWSTPARARGREMGIITYGAPAAAVTAARTGLADAASDAGGVHLRALGRRQRRWAEAQARRCHLGARCLHRLARRLHLDLLVAEVRQRADGVSLRQRLVSAQGGRGGRAERSALDVGGVEAAAYGDAFQALGGRGRGEVTVGTHGLTGLVRFGDTPVGPTPVVRHAVSAGTVRITVSAEGYLDWHRLVAVRPGARVVVRATLSPNPTAVPLAALVPPSRAKPKAPPPAAPAAPAGPAARAGGPDVSPAAVARAADRAAARRRPPATRLPEPRPGVGPGAWVTLGAGVTALAAGAIFGVSAAGNAATAQDPATAQVLVPTLNERMGQQATAANILLAAGTAVTGLGTWLLVHDLTAAPATGP